ncbi:MAG: hypothetical protein DMD44_10665 [Gemmatimonadetes bacterium]|nr:MAG: hypothetical protein DMD44_10665 [Gemmatimonadota bacterium]
MVSWKLFWMPSSSKWLPYARPVRSPKVTVHSLPARPPVGSRVHAPATCTSENQILRHTTCASTPRTRLYSSPSKRSV